MSGEELNLMTSSAGWNALFGLGEGASAFIAAPVAFVAFFLFVLFPLYFALGFAERKLAADLQARVGPNRTPGGGLFQVVADTLKLGAKSAVRGHASLDPKWFGIQNAILFSSFVFVPFGSTLILLDSEMGAFLPFVCMAGVFLCSLFATEGAAELENEILAHRQSFLWISAWVPALLGATVAVARAGSARWSTLLTSQAHGLFHWTAFSSPFGFVAFFVFLLSGLVALQLPPFHSLDRGVRNRAGVRLGLFGLNQFYATLVWCLLASALFLGGQSIPEAGDVSFFFAFYQLVTALAKAAVLFLALRVVARALPQLRQDQMTEFCWRVLTPVAALCLVGELVWIRLFSGGAG
ncbi:MAG: NADH-quinone oxidoreductase subunit H [Bdellovibrionales bacterium]|nr:NADH-quinone oxidoreductase subunit H [Bdellovibrionales bacterium]